MAKILIIDDDALMVRMYQTKLKSDGYEVATAADGKEGMEKIKKETPDLVLLDIMMPVMNGLELLKKLKADKETKNLPIVLLSNVGEEADINKGLEMGAVAYLVKASYTPKEVVQKIKEVLKGYKRDIPEAKVPVKDLSSS